MKKIPKTNPYKKSNGVGHLYHVLSVLCTSVRRQSLLQHLGISVATRHVGRTRSRNVSGGVKINSQNPALIWNFHSDLQILQTTPGSVGTRLVVGTPGYLLPPTNHLLNSGIGSRKTIRTVWSPRGWWKGGFRNHLPKFESRNIPTKEICRSNPIPKKGLESFNPIIRRGLDYWIFPQGELSSKKIYSNRKISLYPHRVTESYLEKGPFFFKGHGWSSNHNWETGLDGLKLDPPPPHDAIVVS